MKARVKATNAIVDVEEFFPPAEDYISGKCYPFEDYYITPNKEVFTHFDLDFNVENFAREVIFVSKTKEVKIEGWVAIDEPFDQAFLYTQKPVAKSRSIADTGDYETIWETEGGKAYLLDRRFFPDMDCESEPRFVTITIKPGKHERD